MSSFPHTAKVLSLFKAQLQGVSANAPAGTPVYLALPTTSLNGGNPGELRLSPEFESQDALEKFCERHSYQYFELNEQIRELGAVPPMFWQK